MGGGDQDGEPAGTPVGEVAWGAEAPSTDHDRATLIAADARVAVQLGRQREHRRHLRGDDRGHDGVVVATVDPGEGVIGERQAPVGDLHPVARPAATGAVGQQVASPVGPQLDAGLGDRQEHVGGPGQLGPALGGGPPGTLGGAVAPALGLPGPLGHRPGHREQAVTGAAAVRVDHRALTSERGEPQSSVSASTSATSRRRRSVRVGTTSVPSAGVQ